MIVARNNESDTDVRVSERMLGLNDMSLLVCLGFIKVNADLMASWSKRGIVVSTSKKSMLPLLLVSQLWLYLGNSQVSVYRTIGPLVL